MPFFAYQDGSGPWTAVTGANGVYDFNISGTQGAVAYVSTSGSPVETHVNLFYLPVAELASAPYPAGTLTVSGTYEGLGVSDVFSGALGPFSEFNGANDGWLCGNVASGTQDLLGLRSTGGLADQLIIHRNVTITAPASPGAIALGKDGDFDFSPTGGGNAIAMTPSTFLLTPGGNEAGISNIALTEHFATAGAASGVLLSSTFAPSLPLVLLPSVNLQAGDQYQLGTNGSTGGPSSQYLVTTAYTANPTSLSLALPPAMTLPTTTPVASTTCPYPLLRTQFTIGQPYNKLLVAYTQGDLDWNLAIQSAYGTDVTFPDLHALAGWNPAWGLNSGTPISASASAFGQTWTTGAPPEGARQYQATGNFTVNP